MAWNGCSKIIHDDGRFVPTEKKNLPDQIAQTTMMEVNAIWAQTGSEGSVLPYFDLEFDINKVLVLRVSK